jgi:hypothetical protein
MFLSAFLLIPALVLDSSFPPALVSTAEQPRAQLSAEKPASDVSRSDTRTAGWLGFADRFRPPVARQVRIERRVIVRIVPVGRQQPDALTPSVASVPLRIVERPITGCVPVSQIAGVGADRGDRLRLHLRSRQVLSVRFGDACRTEAFYSGFFVERRQDGLLCPARDAIHSRSGMRCTVGRISQLVAERAD